jgi:threonine dehydrogenase-like Zn-dependent dehydrogenase
MQTMKALRYLGPKTLKVEEVPVPVLKDNEVLLKVISVGICGSDVHGYLGITGRRIEPMTMGHEFCGEVVENNVHNSKLKIGDRVSVQPVEFCGTCDFCKLGLTNLCENKRFFGVMDVDGAFAEYIAVREDLLFKMPDNVEDYLGALVEPYAVGYSAVNKVSSVEGKSVLVIGAGTIGLTVLQLVKNLNPKKIIVSDLSDTRLAKAKELGADNIINPLKEDSVEAIKTVNGGKQVDFVFEAVGVEATANQSIDCVKPFGEIVWIGNSQQEITINMQSIVTEGKTIKGTYIYTQEEFGQVHDILMSEKIDTKSFITEIIGLEEAVAKFEDIDQNPDKYIKVIVDPRK